MMSVRKQLWISPPTKQMACGGSQRHDARQRSKGVQDVVEPQGNFGWVPCSMQVCQSFAAPGAKIIRFSYLAGKLVPAVED
jgi:hypothetical protein